MDILVVIDMQNDFIDGRLEHRRRKRLCLMWWTE